MASVTVLGGPRHPRVVALAGARRGAAAQLLSGDALVLSGVTRAFGALRAVDDVSLSVVAGERYAILGSNGAGKTTLFNTVTGDHPPTAGGSCSSARTSRRCRRTNASARGCGAPTSRRSSFAR
jgi:branched-chain amino acid transport system ATP-binding protein